MSRLSGVDNVNVPMLSLIAIGPKAHGIMTCVDHLDIFCLLLHPSDAQLKDVEVDVAVVDLVHGWYYQTTAAADVASVVATVLVVSLCR